MNLTSCLSLSLILVCHQNELDTEKRKSLQFLKKDNLFTCLRRRCNPFWVLEVLLSTLEFHLTLKGFSIYLSFFIHSRLDKIKLDCVCSKWSATWPSNYVGQWSDYMLQYAAKHFPQSNNVNFISVSYFKAWTHDQRTVFKTICRIITFLLSYYNLTHNWPHEQEFWSCPLKNTIYKNI